MHVYKYVHVCMYVRTCTYIASTLGCGRDALYLDVKLRKYEKVALSKLVVIFVRYKCHKETRLRIKEPDIGVGGV